MISQKQEPYYIVKTKGNYPSLFHPKNQLNIEVIDDFSTLFSQFLIDLRDIKTDTKVIVDELTVVHYFQNILTSDTITSEPLKKAISPTTNDSYFKGI
jgi:putative protease